jgi:hypothetical protein
MTSDTCWFDANCYRIAFRKLFGRHVDAFETFPVFLDICWDLVSLWSFIIDVSLSRENDNITAKAVSIKVDRDQFMITNVLESDLHPRGTTQV